VYTSASGNEIGVTPSRAEGDFGNPVALRHPDLGGLDVFLRSYVANAHEVREPAATDRDSLEATLSNVFFNIGRAAREPCRLHRDS
jgi:hypothetical protein